MIDLRSRYTPWGGAAAGAVLADAADARLHPYSERLTNGELASVGMVLGDAFGVGGRYRGYLQGASDWAVGNLVSALVRPHLTPPIVVPTVTKTPASTGSRSTGPVGVPASSGSAAYGAGGY
jgi:hypothetical protein